MHRVEKTWIRRLRPEIEALRTLLEKPIPEFVREYGTLYVEEKRKFNPELGKRASR